MKRNLYKPLMLATAFVIANLFLINKSFSQTVVVNPSSPWTVPAGVTSIKVEVWGGGGGGGGSQLTGGTSFGSGGGGGAYNVGTLTVSSGQNYTITIGTGGSAGSDANGGNGTASTVSGPGGTVTAAFGTGGARRGGAAGAGGIGFNNGGAGGLATSFGAGGGGGAGNATPTHTTGNGGDGSNTLAGTAGAGALPGGAGGGNTSSNGTGKPGVVPGGGGGGGFGSFSLAQSGGVGAAGKVVITYTTCTNPTAFTVTGGGGYCSGGSGVAVGLSNSQTGVTYQLFRNGTTAVGSPVSGTGSAISFGNQTTADTYTVTATTTVGGCTANMTGNAVVTINAVPTTSVSGHADVNCNGGSDGTITVLASGGTGPYKYAASTDGINFNWITPGSPYSVSPYPAYPIGSGSGGESGLSANQPYRIKVQDSKGCISK